MTNTMLKMLTVLLYVFRQLNECQWDNVES